MHWNFFFTLAVVAAVTASTPRVYGMRALVLSALLVTMHQVLLSHTWVGPWVESPDRDYPPEATPGSEHLSSWAAHLEALSRAEWSAAGASVGAALLGRVRCFVSMNKEGLVSLPGYAGLAWAGCGSGWLLASGTECILAPSDVRRPFLSFPRILSLSLYVNGLTT